MLKITFYFFLIPLLCFSQKQQKYYYQFNQCGLLERANGIDSIMTRNPANCFCGIEDESIELLNQSLVLPLSIDTFFHDNFSFGFSISIRQSTGSADILSKMRTCNNDTSWTISYQTKDSTFICNLQQGFDKIVQLVGKADPGKCWQQIMITRNSGQFRLFVNGKIGPGGEQNDNFIVRLNNKMPIVFNQSPCNFVNRIDALVDQIIIANYAMNSSEVLAEYLVQDEIITSDTLIFLGASFPLRATSNCASIIQWTPATGLSSTTTLNPLVQPLQQTKYFLRLEQSHCKALDSILIKVIDTSSIDCSVLKLPTAFTPNQDQLNDRYFISNNYIIEKLNYFDILDRNGSLIVRFTDPKDSWDGNWNGNELLPGTYYYRISYTCKDQEYKTKGSFFLMR